ncbi:MAG: PHP domain-containing protein [Clostridiales bacterium]|nr:PHP domain-containing protein [Clostridiales bacterium]
MKTDLHYFDIWPRVFPAGTPVEVTIKPLTGQRKFPGFENRPYRIELLPLCERNWSHNDAPSVFRNIYVTPGSDGCLRFTAEFNGEQEHYIRVYTSMDESCDEPLCQLSVYSLAEDLVGRYPFIGDMHIHTRFSDGSEDPEFVAASYRREGYDFIAITDHRRYYPSLRAIRAYKDVKLGMTLVPGEEVHLPDNDVHIVNFGGRWSVNGLHNASKQYEEAGDELSLRTIDPENCPPVMDVSEYMRQVEEIAAKTSYPEGVPPFVAASCEWGFEHIRQAGGLAIFAHPYWINNTFHVSEKLINFLFEQNKFDAFEVLGGEAYLDQNEFQVMHYNEARIRGWKFPIVGSSDSHKTINNPNWKLGQTIVFSPENEREAIISSVKDFYSVAVGNVSPQYHLAGELRFVRYARFLMDNYFPIHNELCYEEGRMMKEYINGYADAASLSALADRTAQLRKKFFKF